MKNKAKILLLIKSKFFKNTFWGIGATLLQTVFVGLFFVLIARKLSSAEFAQFLIATTVYQLVAAFSSLGLGQWFVRQYTTDIDKAQLTAKFIRTQLYLGLLFYGANILLGYLLYPDSLIRILCLLLGTNIIFDNFINAIRNLNIAASKQKNTAIVLIADGLFKLLIGFSLYLMPFSLIALACCTIAARAITAAIFIVQLRAQLFNKQLFGLSVVSVSDLKRIVLKNWPFIVIGSISIVYWRVGNIIISKILTLNDVADYEIAYRFFSVVQILPVVASATLYPRFVKYFDANDPVGLKKLYRLAFMGYTVLAVVLYYFFYSFSETLVPYLFGNNYPGAAVCLQQMFLTFLLMPTVLLQANVIVAMRMETKDMWFNIVSLLIYLAACFIGFQYVTSLWVINYAIFLSFIAFHLFQDILLIKRKIVSLNHCLVFYVAIIFFALSYQYIAAFTNKYFLFTASSTGLLMLFLIILAYQKRQPGSLGSQPFHSFKN